MTTEQKKIPRFAPDHPALIAMHEDGGFVRYSDYAAALTRIEELTEQVEEMRELVADISYYAPSTLCAESEDDGRRDLWVRIRAALLPSPPAGGDQG